MICIPDCVYCKHNRKEPYDGWRHACDAFPKGIPFDFDYSKVRTIKECNNGIGFEPIDVDKWIVKDST